METKHLAGSIIEMTLNDITVKDQDKVETIINRLKIYGLTLVYTQDLEKLKYLSEQITKYGLKE